MDLAQLITWAAQDGDKVLMDQGAYDELCARAAEGIAARADFDRDFQTLFGRTP